MRYWRFNMLPIVHFPRERDERAIELAVLHDKLNLSVLWLHRSGGDRYLSVSYANSRRSNFDAPTELLLRRVVIQTLAGVTL